MSFSESFCLAQQELQLAKAANEPLENRKKIALTAAKAWGAEAESAAKRDARMVVRDNFREIPQSSSLDARNGEVHD